MYFYDSAHLNFVPVLIISASEKYSFKYSMYQINMQAESPQYLSAKPSFLRRKEDQIFYRANWDTLRVQGCIHHHSGTANMNQDFPGGTGQSAYLGSGVHPPTCLPCWSPLQTLFLIVYQSFHVSWETERFCGLLLPFLGASCSIFLECCSSYSSPLHLPRGSPATALLPQVIPDLSHLWIPVTIFVLGAYQIILTFVLLFFGYLIHVPDDYILLGLRHHVLFILPMPTRTNTMMCTW